MNAGILKFGLACLSLLAAGFVQGRGERLVLDSTKPFVYIEFAHAGERHTPEGVEKALWLNVVNNSSIPIQINTYSKDDNGRDIGINYSVVLTAEGRLKYLHNQQAVPWGHSQDVSSLHMIAPGKKLMFTIPASDVTEFWYIRTSARFYLPREMRGNDPTLSLIFTNDQLPSR